MKARTIKNSNSPLFQKITFINSFFTLIIISKIQENDSSQLDLVKVFELPICCYSKIVQKSSSLKNLNLGQRESTLPNFESISENLEFDNLFQGTNIRHFVRSRSNVTNKKEPGETELDTSTDGNPPNIETTFSFDSSKFYKIIIPMNNANDINFVNDTEIKVEETFLNAEKTLSHPSVENVRKKRGTNETETEIQLKIEETQIHSDNDNSTSSSANYNRVHEFDKVSQETEVKSTKLPSNWFSKLQSALYQSMIMPNIDSIPPQNTTSTSSSEFQQDFSNNETPKLASTLTTTLISEQVKNSKSLWELISNANLDSIEPVTKKITTNLPNYISGKLSGVMVNNKNGIQLHMSSSPSNKIEAFVTGVNKRQYELDNDCICHLIQHGDILLAYWSLRHYISDNGQDELEYLIFPVAHNVPTPPRVQKFESNDLTVLHRPSPVDYLLESYKYIPNNSRKKKIKKPHYSNRRGQNFKASPIMNQDFGETGLSSFNDIAIEFPYEVESYGHIFEGGPPSFLGNYDPIHDIYRNNIQDAAFLTNGASRFPINEILSHDYSYFPEFVQWFHQHRLQQHHNLYQENHLPTPILPIGFPPLYPLSNINNRYAFMHQFPTHPDVILPPPGLLQFPGLRPDSIPLGHNNIISQDVNGNNIRRIPPQNPAPYEFDHPKSIQEIITGPLPHRLTLQAPSLIHGINPPISNIQEGLKQRLAENNRNNNCNKVLNSKRRRMIPTSGLASSLFTKKAIEEAKREKLCKEKLTSSKTKIPKYYDNMVSSNNNNGGGILKPTDTPLSKLVTASYTLRF